MDDLIFSDDFDALSTNWYDVLDPLDDIDDVTIADITHRMRFGY